MSQLYPFTDPIHAQSQPPKRIVSGSGIRVTDDAGNAYVDAVSALWCASLGFNPKRLTDRMATQMAELAYYHSFMGRTPELSDELAKRLVQILPNPLSHVFFGTSGSEIVDTAAKFVRFYQNARGKPNKKRMIARDGAYHGSGQMSAALTGFGYCHDGFDVPLDMVLRTGRPHYLRDAEIGESEVAFSKRRATELDALITTSDPDTIGAFIGEPAMGAGGVIMPPDGYWAEIQNILAKHDILLIADEIITGFGRTGEWFACETYDIKPDMMTMAKQLTASVFPMSAVAMSDEVYDTISQLAHHYETLGHGVTYGGHPVGAAVAIECLDIYQEMDIPNHVKGLGGVLASELHSISNLHGVLDVRSVGLLACVEFQSETPVSLAARVGKVAEEKGVFLRIIGDVLAIAPPYITTPDEIRQIIHVLKDSIYTVTEGTDV